jgi:hypothetical protein
MLGSSFMTYVRELLTNILSEKAVLKGENPPANGGRRGLLC